jgi:hypothetical protein
MNMAGCLSGVLVTPMLGRLLDHIQAGHGSWDLVIRLHAIFYFAAALMWAGIRPDRPLSWKAHAS